jgi:hypothetical protein
VPLADRLCCNIERGDAGSERGVRTPSTGSSAVGSTLGLAWKTNGDILELGPREVLLPKVKPRREASTSHRGVFLRDGLLTISLARTLTTVLPSARADHCWLKPGTAFVAIHSAQSWPITAVNWHVQFPLLTAEVKLQEFLVVGDSRVDKVVGVPRGRGRLHGRGEGLTRSQVSRDIGEMRKRIGLGGSEHV